MSPVTALVVRFGGLVPDGVGPPIRLVSVGVALVVWLMVACSGAAVAGEGSEDDEGEPGGSGDDGGVSVVSEGPVTAMYRPAGRAYNSPQFAAHPEDDDVLALANRLDDPGFACAVHVSGDGGRSWVPIDPVDELPEGAETCYGPQVAFGPDGTLYFLFVGLSGAGNTPMGVFLATSDDVGQSFSEPTQILGGFNFGVNMAVNDEVGERGRLHFTWIDGGEVGVGSLAPGPNPIMAAHSDDAGASLSKPVQVSDADRERVVAPTVEVDDAGRVHVAYYDLGDDARDYQGLEGPVWDGHWELVVASSPDRGASFDTGEVVADEVVPHERIMVVFTAAPPALATSDDGRMCVAWPDARHGSSDVLARCRPAVDEGWHDIVRVNDTPVEDESTQELPQLAIAPNGRIDVVFYDGRGTPNDDYVDVFYAASTDGGRTFTANTRVSQHTSYTEFGPRFPAVASARGMVEFGNRLGLASTDERVVVAWADTRNARARSQGQAIFTAVLADLADDSADWPPPGWAAAAGVAAVGLGGGAVVVRRRRLANGEAAASWEAGP